MNVAPSSSPQVPTLNGPTRCAMRPPIEPSTISGRANRVIPRLAIQSAVFRSSSTSTHSESNVPIMTNTAAPKHSAPRYGRRRNRSKANRAGSMSPAAPPSSTCTRAISGRQATVATTITRNGEAMPNGPTSTAEIAGPRAKPATSAASSMPTLCPRCSGSARITIRRIAGSAMPAPMPITNRPAPSTSASLPKAMASTPTTFSAIPTYTRWRAWPRSARGANSTWATNEAKKPTATTALSAASEMP